MAQFSIHRQKLRKTMSSAIVMLLCLALLGSILVCSAAGLELDGDTQSSSSGQVIRVGLYYASGALPTANLQNAVGSGFYFGYYDDDYDFVRLGWTNVEAITMVKDKNMYLTGSEYSEYGGNSMLGCYHVQLPWTYSNYEAAQDAATSYNNAFPAYVGGEYVVRVGNYNTLANAENAAQSFNGGQVVGGSSTCITVCKMITTEILFEYDPGTDRNFAVMPRSVNGEKTQTWFKGHKYYGGFHYTRASGNDITVMNFVDIDDYTAGVIPYEMSASWELEALKAQAVCARSYALSSDNHKTFDVCCSTCCQVYRGVYEDDYADNVTKAITETAGQCAYYNGEVIRAYFHAADGGATESAENTWGSALPYVKGTIDPYESDTSYDSWIYIISPSELTEILNNNGYSNNGIKSVEVSEFSATGNVNELTFTTNNGNKIRVTGDETRAIFNGTGGGRCFSRHYKIIAPYETYYGPTDDGLSVYVNGDLVTDNGFTVQGSDGQSTVTGQLNVIGGDGTISQVVGTQVQSSEGVILSVDSFAFVGSGYGHNVGMSQFGARSMAKLGFTYDEIIKFYFKNVEIH